MNVERIKDYLESTGMSQTALAEQSGIAFATLNRILNGKQQLQMKTAKKIADALGMSVIDIMEEDDTIPQQNNGVSGYLEYQGEITKIKSLKQLEKWVEEIKAESQIPVRAKAIIAENEKNRKAVSKNNPNQCYHFNLDFDSMEEYDAAKLDCWSWKTADEEKDGIRLDLGNQCSGYEFDWNGYHFFTVESFYLMGQFSGAPTDELTRIQNQLLYEKNGYTAKKKIKNANKHLIRPDWNEIAPHWMLYVVWQKCLHCKPFADLLKSIPMDAILMENSTTIREVTSSLWDVKNQELEDARDIVGKYAEMRYLKQCRQNGTKPNRAEADRLVQEARNTIHYIGKYTNGKNYMGKILKRCQLALLDGVEPEINYSLLRSKQIFLFGQLMIF